MPARKGWNPLAWAACLLLALLLVVTSARAQSKAGCDRGPDGLCREPTAAPPTVVVIPTTVVPITVLPVEANVKVDGVFVPMVATQGAERARGSIRLTYGRHVAQATALGHKEAVVPFTVGAAGVSYDVMQISEWKASLDITLPAFPILTVNAADASGVELRGAEVLLKDNDGLLRWIGKTPVTHSVTPDECRAQSYCDGVVRSPEYSEGTFAVPVELDEHASAEATLTQSGTVDISCDVRIARIWIHRPQHTEGYLVKNGDHIRIPAGLYDVSFEISEDIHFPLRSLTVSAATPQKLDVRLTPLLDNTPYPAAPDDDVLRALRRGCPETDTPHPPQQALFRAANQRAVAASDVCRWLGASLVARGKKEEAARALDRACKLGSGPACEELGWMLRFDDEDRSAAAYSDGCSQNREQACVRELMDPAADRQYDPTASNFPPASIASRIGAVPQLALDLELTGATWVSSRPLLSELAIGLDVPLGRSEAFVVRTRFGFVTAGWFDQQDATGSTRRRFAVGGGPLVPILGALGLRARIVSGFYVAIEARSGTFVLPQSSFYFAAPRGGLGFYANHFDVELGAQAQPIPTQFATVPGGGAEAATKTSYVVMPYFAADVLFDQ